MTTRRVPCLCLCLAMLGAACSREDSRAVRAARESRDVEAVAQEVHAAPRTPATGKWDRPTLTKRLIDAGLAPRSDDSLPSHPDYGVTPVAFRIGKAHVLAWIYADRVAREFVSDGIDTLAAIPGGQRTKWDEPPMFVMQNNLILVVVGGGDRQRERVRLAVEAGLAHSQP